MARTNRKDVLEAAQHSASVDALDDLNLDDMFNDGLFDEFVDLDGMGDIANTNKNSDPKPQQDFDEINLDLLGGSDVLAATTDGVPSARRTTKRKIKSPSFPSLDSDDEEYEPTKKRRRSAAAKKKGAKAAAAGKRTAATPNVKKKAVPGKTTKSSPSGVLETASKGKKIRGTAPHTSSQGTVRSESNNFCGLHPSNVVFYPFMPALPPEPTLKKSSRLYSVLNSIHAATSSTQSAPTAPTFNASETDPILNLLLVDDQPSASSAGGSSDPTQRRHALGSAVEQARQAVQRSDKAGLVSDLQSVCILVKKQFEFLSQSLDNMERWSRDSFSEQDHVAIYGSLLPRHAGRKHKSSLDGGVGVTSLGGKVGRGLFRNNIFKVKIKCIGFKAPKQSRPLLAKLPQRAGAASQAASSSVASKTEKGTKKRRSLSTDAKVTSVTVAVEEKAVAYAQLKPWQRRHRVTEAINQRAFKLDMQHREAVEKRRRVLERQNTDLQKIVDDDVLELPNTVALWKWIEKSAYFSEFCNDDVTEVLKDLWESIFHEREASHPLLSAGGHPSSLVEVSYGTGNKATINRLQSLLVDVASDSEDEEDTFAGDDDWDSTDTLDFLPKALFDLSGFSMEERAYLHLRAAGLVRGPVTPKSIAPGVASDDAKSTSERSGAEMPPQPSEENNGMGTDIVNNTARDIDDAIDRMQEALVGQVRTNNERVMFLESAARSHGAEVRAGKKKRDEEALLISRYNQLLKKQKETKRTARQKTAKKDEDWVPW